MNTKVKLALAVIVAAAASLATNAQLIINNNGSAHFGDTTVVDTTVTVHLAGTGANGSRAKLAFGNKYNNIPSVLVGEYAVSNSNSDTDCLWLHGNNGLFYTVNAGRYVALRHAPYSLVGFNFRAPISSRCAYIAADPILSSESTSVNTALSVLQGLEGIRYRMDLPVPSEGGLINSSQNLDEPAGTNGIEGGAIPPVVGPQHSDSLHYGLDLASVQQTLPELVTVDQDGIRYVDYNSIVSLLVVAVNELKGQVDSLTAQLDGSAPVAHAPARAPQTSGTDGITDDLTAPALYQNIPNPFTADTHIRYCLPESVQQADLYIYDMQGHQIKKIAVTGRGESAVTIHGSELQAGMYIYALIADGQEIDSKRMILTK